MRWDYIIVGAGSAGCALAYELVRSGHTVLVLEAGGPDRSPFIKVAAGQARAVAKHDWGYRSQPDPTRNGASEHWARGRVLGGSSSINGTMFVRGTARDFDRWNLPGWAAEEVMPIFREYETSDQPGPLRGHGGPLHVRTVRQPHAISEAFVESARAVGYAFNEDYNGASQEGVGYAQLSQRRGWRCSAADAFLKPLLGKRNIKLLLHALVEKIEVVNGKATAVSFWHRGGHRRETACDIVLCAGSINTPKLLMLSGIGDPQELEHHGIPVNLNLSAVGRHLKEHPMVAMTYRSRIPTYNLTEGLPQKLRIAMQFLVNGEGAISNLFEGAAFIRSSTSEPVPDLQVIFLAFGYSKSPQGNLALTPYPSVTVLILRSYPRSSGRVRLASSDPKAAPLIECRLLQEHADVAALAHGVQKIREIMRAQPIAALLEKEETPGTEIAGEQALQDFVREHTGISFHPIGTCRMGVGPDAVVNPELRVLGTENLWIADASILPDHISGNMNAPSMMIGMKLGKQLAAGLKPSSTHPSALYVPFGQPET